VSISAPVGTYPAARLDAVARAATALVWIATAVVWV
jgi:hypothetical protein